MCARAHTYLAQENVVIPSSIYACITKHGLVNLLNKTACAVINSGLKGLHSLVIIVQFSTCENKQFLVKYFPKPTCIV